MANPVRCSRVSNALKSVFLSAVRPSDAASLPGFLVPAYVSCRTTYPPFSKFSTTAAPRSKIGRAPLSIPPEVKFNVTPLQQQQQRMNLSSEVGSRVEIEGPRGKTIVDVPPYICITGSEGGRLQSLTVQNAEERRQREMWGTTRALLQNALLGVSEGHTAILRLVGVGYRATIENTAITQSPAYPGQKFVSLKVGYSHPIELGVPQGVTASTPQPTRILLEGVDKESVMRFAAEIRAWRRPEPYKGKGIFVNEETVKLKAKKIK